MNNLITGVFEYEGKEYSFSLEKNIVRLTGLPFQFLQHKNEGKEVPTIHGVTSDNRDILFLCCKLYSPSPFSNIAFSIQGFLISSNNTGKPCLFDFDRITFYSDVIDNFYSPQNALEIKTEFDNWDGSIQINIKPFCDTDIKFNFNSDECQLNIARFIGERKNISSIGSVKSSFSFNCKKRSLPTEVKMYYLALYDFLRFTTCSSNVTFKKIELQLKNEDNKYSTIAYVHMYSNNSGDENSEFDSITINDIPKEKLEVLFNKVVSMRNTDYRLPFYFPQSKNDDRTIDSGKWLMMALNFEGLFNDTFQNFKSKNKPAFAKAKEIVIEQIKSYDTSVLSPKEQKYYTKCLEHVERYEGTLEEKFNYAFKKYKSILSKIVLANERYYSCNKNENYANIYSSYRNKTAHGSVIPLTVKEIAVYRLLRPMIYTMIMDGILSEEEITQIISKLFR